MKIVVSETVKPPAHAFYGDAWERGLDPWHIDAFQGFSEDIKDQVRDLSPGQRSGGWFLIDGAENAIGFVKDGSVFEVEEPCKACRGTGAEFPEAARSEKCEECDGRGKL